jgi:hypothetical protein
MTGKKIAAIIGTIAFITAVVVYLWVRAVRQGNHVPLPSLPQPVMPVPPTQRIPLTMLDAAAMQKFIAGTMEKSGLPVRVVNVELEPTADRDAAQKIDLILSQFAFPYMHGSTFYGFISLGRRCSPNEPCGTQVLAPSQIGLTDMDVEEFRERARWVLAERVKPPIRDEDLVFRVEWATDSGEHFTTYLVTSKDNKPKFESMLYLSPIEKRCAERSPARGPQETTLEWDGEVVNGFGMVVVRWHGNATYRFQDGRLLTADPCPNRTCLKWNTELLWEVDGDHTTVTTTPVADSKPEEATLAYQVTWGIWFPKVTLPKGGIEIPALKGNVHTGSFSLRGDGTWNKIN